MKIKRGTRYRQWVSNHTGLLNVLDNDVGYVSDVATIAGLFLGVTDVFAVAKVAEEAEEGVMAVKDVKETETSLRVLGKGVQGGEKSVGKFSIQKTVELKNMGISRADLSTYTTLTSDVTGVVSGGAQAVQGSTSGVGQGELFGVTAGILNAGFSGLEISSIYKNSAAATAEKEVERIGAKSFKSEDEKLAAREAAKLKSDTLAKSAKSLAKTSDSLNLALGTVLSVGVGIYYAASGSAGSGAVTIAYGGLYGIGSFKNQISTSAKKTWTSFFSEELREVGEV